MIEIKPELGFPQQVQVPDETYINIGLHEDGDMCKVSSSTVVFVTGPWINGGYPVEFIDVDGELKRGAYYLHHPPPENEINQTPTLHQPNDPHQV